MYVFQHGCQEADDTIFYKMDLWVYETKILSFLYLVRDDMKWDRYLSYTSL